MNKKYLKVISLFLAFTFLFSVCASASGLDILVERREEGTEVIQSIKVTGELQKYEENEYISLKLYDKGLDENNLSVDDYKYLMQTKVGANGKFELNFEFSEIGEFSFVAATPKERVTGEKYISDLSAILQLISGLNDGTITYSDAVSMVEENNKELLFDVSLYKDFSEDVRLLIWQKMISENKPDFSIDNIYTSFDKFSIICGINGASSSSAVKNIVEHYNEKYLKLNELSIEGVKSTMTATETDTLYGLMRNCVFSDIDSIKNRYVEAVILSKYKNVSNYLNIPDILSSCKNEANIVSEMVRYESLSDIQKKAFSRYLADERNVVVSIADNETGLKGKVKFALNNIYYLVEKYTVAPPANAGGGGGGGGGSSANIAVSNDFIPKNETEDFGYLLGLSDVGEVEWAKDAILSLFEKGVISGKEPGKFKPNDNVTRAEITKMLATSLEIYDEKSESPFEDCKNHWGYRYISSVANKGYIVGVNDIEFKPDNKITRQDIAVVLYRIIQYSAKSQKVEDVTKTFTDASAISDYARNSVLMLAEYGILNGFSDGSFKPNDNLTRAQAAVVIVKLLEFIGK